MEVKAKAKYLRTSPRKIRLVINLIRGLDAKAALVQLDFINKAAAQPVKKLLSSALANATNNFKLDKDNLYIGQITANEGPTLKRWMPRAFGRATPIRKRSTHIAVTLVEKVPSQSGKKIAKKEGKDKKNLEVVQEKPKESLEPADKVETKEPGVVAEEVKPEIFDETRQGKHRDTQHQDKKQLKKAGRSFVKRLFSRKSGM